MDEYYTLCSFITNGSSPDTASFDLSPFFLTAGVANPSYQNVSWRLLDVGYPEPITYDTGPVYADGSLGPVSSGLDRGVESLGSTTMVPPFIFTDIYPYHGHMQLQIKHMPDPCQPCQCPPPTGQNCCPASPTSSNSVELATGKFVFQKNLLSLAALGSGSWSFDLDYKSNFDIEGILGKNFAYRQFMHLEQLGPSDPSSINIQLVTDKLSRAIFDFYDLDGEGRGIYTTPTGNNTRSTLIWSGVTTNLYTLTAADGTITTFFGFPAPMVDDYPDAPPQPVYPIYPGPGQIKTIADRFGNSQELEWTSVGTVIGNVTTLIPQLSSVTDAYGRIITYSYYGSDGGYRLKQITDFLGRQLNFQYDAFDHLVAVLTPSILKAAPGNTFPGGTAYVFQYDVNNANPARRDDLIRIWYPNQTQPYLDLEARTVDIEAVYGNAQFRYEVTYGQSINDSDTYGKVLTETLGDPENGVGGAATFDYTTCSDDLPTNIIDTSSAGTIVSRTVHTDRNGNKTIYDFNAFWTVSRLEADLNRSKNSLEVTPVTSPPNPAPFVTWTAFNAQNQPLITVYPEGNSVQYIYETGVISGLPVSPYVARQGLLLSESHLPGNSIGISSRAGSNGQIILTKRYFYEPIFNQLCAVIEERANPINGSTYFVPQNGGTTPTNADCSRYAILDTFDYQKDTLAVVSGDTTLQSLLGLTETQIQTLIAYVNSQMTATDGTGGIPVGFPLNLGDINGDGTGNGASSGLPDATHLGNLIKITHPSVLLVGGTTQNRIELFTVNLSGQTTTATDPEGNLTVTVRYPENDPEGGGQNISPTLSTQQYGLVREIHRDANPDDVMSLVGASGDLVAFVPGLITRTNTPNVYQDLVTRYEGSSGCISCAYDAMGNVLNQTDPRGFTTIYDRNEMGEIYRVTSSAPYSFRVETSYDANRNVIQLDTEDWQVLYNSSDPTASGYGTFTPSGSGTTAHVPMIQGPGGALRPGWFSNLMSYDLLDDKIEDDIDATGSTPANLITQYQYDANQNLIEIIKPEGNTVEYDYDERDLKIVERVGGTSGAVTAYSYDGNKNLINVIGPVDHNQSGTTAGATSQTVYIANAFGSGSMLTVTGDWVLQNIYDGFDRVITAKDAVAGVVNSTYDPTSTLIQKQTVGVIGGASPINRSGAGNTPLANTILRFDEGLRLYEQQQDVYLATGSTLGSTRAVTHTGGGLATNSTANNHNGTVTLTTGGTSYVLTRTIYDRANRVVNTLADNTAPSGYSYDGANRQILVTDSLGNTVATQFDGNGNPTQVTRTEVCTITTPTVANEIFVSFTWFDCLNRPVVAGTQGADGNLTANLNLCCPWMGPPSTLYSLMGYDSRGNQTTVTDPKLNVIVSVYDGASRLIETQQEMRQNGDGRNAPAANQTFLTAGGGGVIRTEYLYDGNSRLIELVDDRGASTVYGYDALDRQITKTLADGSVGTKAYDLSSCLIGYTDENGSVFVFTFDALSRKITTAITRATNVIGTTAQSFQYDGLSRNTKAVDTVTSTSAEVDFVYDSLNRVLEETQIYGGNTRYTTHTAWISLPATQVTYPTTDITLSNGYDLLYRRNSLSGVSAAHGDLDSVVWQFFGPKRIVEANYGSGSLIVTQMNNARTHSAVQATVPQPAWGNISTDQLGYDGVGRMITKRYLTGGINGTTHAYNNTTSLVGYTTSFDRASNKLYERHLEAESRSHLYQPFNLDGSFAQGYDSANRLLQYQRGVLSTATIPYLVNAGASISSPITLPGTDQARTYGLDGLGNWKNGSFTLVGSGGSTTTTAEVRQHNYVNEITSVKDTTGGTPTTTGFAYDHGNNTNGIQGNGNLVNDGVRIYKWDAFNRLIQISNISSTVLATYVYDALGRRMQKTIANGGLTGDIPNGTTDYLYDGQQIIEERNDSAPTIWTQVYFWGQYIDQLLFFALPTATVYRVLSDLLYRSVAICTTSNVVTEAYDTDGYGNTLCYSGPGTDGLWFTNDDVRTNNPINTTIFTGRQYDPESQIYYYRARYYSPNIGRFISRDPLGSALETNVGMAILSKLDFTRDVSDLIYKKTGVRLDTVSILDWLSQDQDEPQSAELSQGPNLYWYVRNNPINATDPTGLYNLPYEVDCWEILILSCDAYCLLFGQFGASTCYETSPGNIIHVCECFC
jgi:RHS repeat-associated protein